MAEGQRRTSEVPPKPEGSKRILILMSDTGGGHRASARALAAALEKVLPGELDIIILDILTEFGVWPLGNVVEDYKTLMKAPNLYGLMYGIVQLDFICTIVTTLAKLTNGNRFRECFEAYQPDLVVSVHPLLQALCVQALGAVKPGANRVPFATVVTDLCSGFPTWFHPGVDLCCVPSQELYLEAKRLGLSDDKLRLHGLPVRKEFWTSGPDKATLRPRLGLAPTRKTVLLMNGGDGIGGLPHLAAEIHRHLVASLPADSQLVVICGSNAAVRRQLEATPWPTVPVLLEGFTPAIADYMGAADVLVTKAGPGTITEACLRGLPCILSGFIPGQETGNVRFVQDRGFGVYVPQPTQIAKTVVAWLSNAAQLQALSDAAAAAAQPEATLDIASDLLALLPLRPPSPLEPATDPVSA